MDKKFYKIDTWGQSYKTFNGSKLRFFVKYWAYL